MRFQREEQIKSRCFDLTSFRFEILIIHVSLTGIHVSLLFSAFVFLHSHARAGKTLTLVEAILQVLDRRPSAHLLVVAPSDSAADVVTARLHAFIPQARFGGERNIWAETNYACAFLSFLEFPHIQLTIFLSVHKSWARNV